MAGCAAEVLEYVVALDLLCRHRLLVTFQIAVERTVGSQQSLLVLGDGICDGSLAETLRVHLGEEFRELLVLGDSAGDLIEVLASHLYRVERRTACLLGEGCRTSVPELHEIEHGVERCRSIDSSLLSADTFRVAFVVDTCGLHRVAGRAGNGSVCGKPGVVVEDFSESGLCRIIIDLVRDRADRFVGELRAGQKVGIEGSPQVLDP